MKSPTIKIYILMLFLVIGTTMCYCKDDNDDDEIISEIMIDLLLGVLIEECSYYKTCSTIMSSIFIIVLLTALCMCLISGECHMRGLSKRELRRVGTTYTGMRLRRSYR